MKDRRPPAKARKRRGDPARQRQHGPANALISDGQPLDLGDNQLLLSYPTWFVGLCFSSPGKRIHPGFLSSCHLALPDILFLVCPLSVLSIRLWAEPGLLNAVQGDASVLTTHSSGRHAALSLFSFLTLRIRDYFVCQTYGPRSHMLRNVIYAPKW